MRDIQSENLYELSCVSQMTFETPKLQLMIEFKASDSELSIVEILEDEAAHCSHI